MRKLLIGCGILFGVVTLLCVGSVWYLFREPNIQIPMREYPPNNAYERYRLLGERMYREFDGDTRFKQIEDALVRGATISAGERTYYLQRIEPYLRAYAPLTTQPSKVILEYGNPDQKFYELAQFRRLVRAEAYLMREALRRQRYAEVANRLRRITLLAEQARAGGALIHYLVGTSILAIGWAPVREELPRLQNRELLQQLVQVARSYERQRTPLWRALEEEQYNILALYQQIARGERDLRTLASTPKAQTEQFRMPMRLLVNLASLELKRLMGRGIRELQKPFHERDLSVFRQEPKQLLNAIFYPVFFRAAEHELAEVATMRLIGCVAAIRLHKLHTGSYPASLEALQLGEMAIDPYSGKPFRYRVDAKRGFLLYSVGENRVDDGGAVPYDGFSEPRGDLSPVLVPAPKTLRPLDRNLRPLAPPQWLR